MCFGRFFFLYPRQLKELSCVHFFFLTVNKKPFKCVVRWSLKLGKHKNCFLQITLIRQRLCKISRPEPSLQSPPTPQRCSHTWEIPKASKYSLTLFCVMQWMARLWASGTAEAAQPLFTSNTWMERSEPHTRTMSETAVMETWACYCFSKLKPRGSWPVRCLVNNYCDNLGRLGR